MIFPLCQPDIPEMSYIMCFRICWYSLFEQVFNALIWAMGNSCRLSFTLKFLSDLENFKT